jgi:hypothetical protein
MGKKIIFCLLFLTLGVILTIAFPIVAAIIGFPNFILGFPFKYLSIGFFGGSYDFPFLVLNIVFWTVTLFLVRYTLIKISKTRK